uniref:Ras association domain family member 5 n=1 Tax=Poecilia reticulata TaxID=8081 RepID=A0A3P9N7B8_POERE
SVMASVSVVGQQPGPHRLDSEPPILLFKLSGTKKKITLPRRSSWEKMMLARSGAESGSDAAEEELRTHPLRRPGPRRGLPLERLTQGKTGVVKLARTEPHRREAWSIFPREMDPRVRAERGEGHRFETKPVKQDWCDACSRQITAQGLKCQNCSYTCHLECERQVQLDCNQRDRETEDSPVLKTLSSLLSSFHYVLQAADGSFTGFIKVHLRLSRPVTVEGDRGRASSEDQDGEQGERTEKRTSFYLPCDCVKQIHIGSLTTTSEVIQGLLKKFMVLDDPRKFALYRQTHRDGQDLFQKLPLSEHPLVLRLKAGPDPEQLTFVLKENETGEVEWHAFSVPELQNFLVILEKEEAERVRAVQQKYTIYRQKLQQALQQHSP